MLDIILDALLDTSKLIPVLFITYLIMEWLEHLAGERASKMMERSGRFGPLIGSALGVVPQCGFSGAAAGLFAGGVISAGTLVSVFLSTSDEMLPIMVSRAVAPTVILKILTVKLIIGIIAGFAVDLVWRKKSTPHIHCLCENEHCGCESSIWRSALKHTASIGLFIFLVTLGLSLLLEWVGEQTIGSVMSSLPVVSELLAGLIGLIPNCASSVIITDLYLQGAMSSGAMIAGLCVNSGVGLLILFRTNRNIKINLLILSVLYAVGVTAGMVISLLGITF